MLPVTFVIPTYKYFVEDLIYFVSNPKQALIGSRDWDWHNDWIYIPSGIVVAVTLLVFAVSLGFMLAVGTMLMSELLIWNHIPKQEMVEILLKIHDAFKDWPYMEALLKK